MSIQCKMELNYLCNDKVELQRIVSKFNLVVTPLYCNHVIMVTNDILLVTNQTHESISDCKY